MFTIEQIQSLNELELEVYQYVMQHQTAVPYMRIRELAAEAHVSTTTVLRFCKKMDCDGYAEFKLRMKQFLGQQSAIAVPDDLYELRTFLERLETASYQKILDQAASVIAKADRVLCVGICNSGHVAEYAARYISSFGKFALSVTDPFYPAHQINDSMNTAALVFSVSGEAINTLKLAREFKKHGCRMICITNTDQTTLSRLSDVTLPYFITLHRTWEDAEKGIPEIDFSSQVPAVILAEVLAKRLAERLTEE